MCRIIEKIQLYMFVLPSIFFVCSAFDFLNFSSLRFFLLSSEEAFSAFNICFLSLLWADCCKYSPGANPSIRHRTSLKEEPIENCKIAMVTAFSTVALAANTLFGHKAQTMLCRDSLLFWVMFIVHLLESFSSVSL